MKIFNSLLLAGCVAAGGSLTAQDTVLWDFETVEQYNQWIMSTMYPEGLTGHGTLQWYEFPDQSGGLSYTVVLTDSDAAVGGSGFRWAVEATVTPEDPQFEALRDAVLEGKTLAYDVYRHPDEGSSEWFQTFFTIQGNPGGRQNQWNNLTEAAWPADEPLTMTATIDFSAEPNQADGEGAYMPASPESIMLAFAVNGPVTSGSIIVFDNIRIPGEDSGGDGWFGYTIDEAGWADTGEWLGFVWVDSNPWVWAGTGWLYFAEETYDAATGVWTYAPRFGE